MFTQKKIAHFLSLIIPVYKQERTIVKDVKQIKQVLDSIRYDHEIIVVFDGVADQSYKKVKQANIPKVKTISYLKNQGKSHAIQLGMKKAVGDYVMFIDSGMEIDPNSISMLLEHMEWYNADVIVGSKRHPASQVNYVASRKLLSEGYYFVVKFLFGIKVRDTQAGIKIFKKKVLEKILPRMVGKKFTGDLEMLVIADTLGFKRIYEAPIKLDYTLAGFSSASTIKSIFNIMKDTLAIWYRKNILRYYQV
ncbi:MAG: glycosyltransferase family 2 protein [Patescibacteria group bacterium]